MMRQKSIAVALLGMALAATCGSRLPAADLEAFEFNDSNGTSLALTANSINPANVWLEDPQMFPSDTRGGAYNIVHTSTILESNYLQIGNVTTGNVYLVARISGWKFGATIDAANLEEVRFGFLNDDDADFGSTITSQMTFQRLSGGNIALGADALGAGSTNIVDTATFAPTRSTPLTVALELNKTSNSYKVFYKDNSNATQVLGIGTVSSGRDGNSVRFATNNSFDEGNSDYPVVPFDEVFSVDRIAVTNTNPFNDLITLEINRGNGAMTLRNSSGVALTGLQSYTISSGVGAFDPSKWKTITGNYDTGSGGNGTVDNAPWAVTSSTKTTLSESFQSGDGGGLTINQEVVLSGLANATWVKSPFEDVTMTLNFASGPRTVNVNFSGNVDEKWEIGDLDFDRDVTPADYTILAANAETNLAGLTRVEAYRRGDLDGNGANSIEDFIQFKSIYDTLHGAGSFAAMLAGVPEPGSLLLAGMAGAAVLTLGWRRRERVSSSPSFDNSRENFIGDFDMSGLRKLVCLIAALAASAVAPVANATILEDFTFSDANGTTLDGATNSAHGGNNWTVTGTGTGELTNSSVLNGSFRIQKTTTNLSSNYIDIANITAGKAWLVAEMAGWNFTSTASSPSEEMRFAFLDNDSTPPAGSTITAQMDIRRGGTALSLVGMGAGGTGASNVSGAFALPLVRSTPFTMVLELDKGNDQYSVYYKDNANPFQLLGTANLGTSTLNAGDRDGNSIRFAPTGAYNDTDEFFDISRVYLTDTSPLGGPVTPVTLSLEVRSNGLVFIKNETANPISFDSYRIASVSSSLNATGWSSLSDQGVDPFMGGDSAGETWDEAGGSSDAVLAESFLLSASTIPAGMSYPLGSAFKVGGVHDLTFQYRDSVSLALPSVVPTYVMVAAVAGDYNSDGTVNAADYTIWRDTLGSTTDLRANGDNTGASLNKIDQADYTFWKSRFGMSGAGSGALAIAAPEPGAWAIVAGLVSIAPLAIRRRSWKLPTRYAQQV